MHKMRIKDINLEFQDMEFGMQGEKDVREIMLAIKRGETIPPILVSENGYLQDGRHRLAAYSRLGYTEIDVETGDHPNANTSNKNKCGFEYIARVSNGVPVDDIYEPLKKTKRKIIISNIPIPAGSYIGYVITDGGSCHNLFANKTMARKDYRSSRKYYSNPDEEIALMEVYITPDGKFIDSVSI